MTSQTPRASVNRYLEALEQELSNLPFTPAHELYTEIETELNALSDEDAVIRIAALGTPALIAEELADAHELARAQDQPEQRTSSALERTPYVLLVSFAVAVGGLVIPALGWIAGIVLMWLSPVWSKVQKLLTNLAPLLAIPVVLILQTFMSGSGLTTDPGSGGTNPLVPATYDLVWSGVLIATIPVFVSGVILLIVGMRRTNRLSKP